MDLVLAYLQTLNRMQLQRLKRKGPVGVLVLLNCDDNGQQLDRSPILRLPLS